MNNHTPAKGDLTLAEAAEREGVTTRTVSNWIREGYLPAYRVGPRLIRIRPADLDALRRPVVRAGRV